jgi:glutaredoxin-like protein
MSESIAVNIYATEWCFDCRRARKFFDLHQIPYEWVNIDRDPKAEQYVLKVNRGMRSVPTIVFNDGSILVEPNDTQLADKLGLNKS